MKNSIKVFMSAILISEIFTGCIEREGCTDSNAKNFDPSAEKNDGSCIYKKKGCMDIYALNYDATAEEDNGICLYLSGSYSMFEDCGTSDHFIMTITENGGSITLNNVAGMFDGISAVRTGAAINILPKAGAVSHTNEIFDFGGGTGVINLDVGTSLSVDYSFDDINYGNVYGSKTCTAEGSK